MPLTGTRPRGTWGPMRIYKIFRAAEWAALQAAGQTRGASVDLADGYIHFSTADQAAATAAKHFAGEDDLWLIAVETDGLGGQRFPHLYRNLRLADVSWAQPLPLDGGVHTFPDDFA